MTQPASTASRKPRRGTADVLKRLCGGARTTVSFGAERCKYLRNDTRNAIGDAKRGVLAALRPGIVQGEGAETPVGQV
jgi:hypothetical protein